MSVHRLRLRPGGVIPPAINIGIRLPRVAPPVIIETVREVEAEGLAPVVIPAGADVWYDSPSVAVIPFANYAGVVSADTPANALTLDDDFDSETDKTYSVQPLASAWWQLTTPADITSALLLVNTWPTRGGLRNSTDTGPAAFPTDTNISLYTTSETPPLGPLPVVGVVDFDDLTRVEHSDDDPQPGSSFPYLSAMTVALEPNKVYWICVDTWGGEESPGAMYADELVYRLQVTLLITP